EPVRSVAAPDLYAAAGTLGSLGLARPTPDGLLLHRLTQPLIIHALADTDRAQTTAAATALLHPPRPRRARDPRPPATWHAPHPPHRPRPHARCSATAHRGRRHSVPSTPG